MLSKDVEAVKFLWKRKHFDEKDWKRKRLTLSGAGSELASIKLQEELEAEALKT